MIIYYFYTPNCHIDIQWLAHDGQRYAKFGGGASSCPVVVRHHGAYFGLAERVNNKPNIKLVYS